MMVTMMVMAIIPDTVKGVTGEDIEVAAVFGEV